MATFIDQLLQDPSFLTGVSLLGGQTNQIGRNILGAQQTIQGMQAQRQLQEQRQAAMDLQARRQSFNPMQYYQDGRLNVPGFLSGAFETGQDIGDVSSLLKTLAPPSESKLMNVAPGGAVFDPATRQPIYNAPFKPEAPPSRSRVEGDSQVFEQFDPNTMQWREISRGPRSVGEKAPIEVADPTSPTGTRMVTPAAAVGMPGKSLQAKEGPGKGKTLPAGTVNKLAEYASQADRTNNLLTSFQDTYGGFKNDLVGEAANKWARTFGDSTGQAKWWQDMEREQTQIRHDLMGSQLTQYEGTQFDKFRVTPGQDPSVIRKNLEAQKNLVEQANKKRMEFFGKAGYDMSGFGMEEPAAKPPTENFTLEQLKRERERRKREGT